MIAQHIDGIIMICVGFYTLYIAKKPKLQPYKKTMKSLAIILFVCGVLLTAIKPFFDKQSNNVSLLDMVKTTNDSIAGMYIDDITRIDSVTLIHQNELVYNYSIVNIKSKDVNSDYNTQFNALSKKGIVVICRYFSADSMLITEIKINPIFDTNADN